MDTRLLRMIYRLGSTSFQAFRETLKRLGGEHGEAAAYVQELTPQLQWQLQRWRRRQILASLLDEDPSKAPPPPGLRIALLEAIVEKGRLPINDQDLMLIMEGLGKVEEKGEKND